MPTLSRFSVRAWAVAACVVAVGCGGHPDMAAVGLEHASAEATHRVRRAPARSQRLFVAAPDDRLLGPLLARGDDRHLVAWVDNDEKSQRRIRALVVDDAGVPVEPIHELIAGLGDVTSLVAEKAGGADSSFVVAWSTLGTRGESISVVGVSKKLDTRGAAVEIARSSDHVVWTKIVPTRAGAVVLWAEETRERKANVLSIALDEKGRPRGVPTFVARGVISWREAPSSSGVSLGVLTPGSRAKDGKGDTLSLFRLDDEGRPRGPATPIVTDGTVPADVEMSRLGASGVLFAWTRESGLDPSVQIAVVDERDRVTPPRSLSGAFAGARLLSVRSAPRGAVLAWERPAARPRASRRVTLERLTETGESVASTVLELEGKGAPEMVSTDRGVTVLGRMRVCGRAESEDGCRAAPFTPALVELDESLLAVRAERIEAGDPPEAVAQAWGLVCGARCLALSLGTPEKDVGQPVLASPGFGKASSDARVVVAPLYAPGRPKPRALATVLRTEPVMSVAVGRSGGASTIAIVTRGEEGPRGANGGKPAALYLVPVDRDGHEGEATAFAPRVAPAGGASFATAPDGSLVLAWVAREDGGERVHLTRLVAGLKRATDMLVTTKKSEMRDVTVAAVDGGFIVAWIDGRDGEVYAARVSSDLARVSEHQRLTTAPGDASDLTMTAHPSGVAWLAWTDPRESPREGSGDIYVAAVRAKDARIAVPEARVLATAAHSRSPSLSVSDDGVALGWIEEAPIGTDAAGHAAYGAMLAVLDARGHAVREPARLTGASVGAPMSIVLDPTRGGARGVLVRSADQELSIDAFTVEKSGAIVSSWLGAPEGPPTLDLPLAFDGEALVYAEESRGASEHKVRRMSVTWP